MSPDDAVGVRLNALENAVYDLQKGKASRRDLDGLAMDFRDLVTEVRSLRNALIIFALTVAVSAIGVAFAVLQARP
jgi:hypothetical protein